MANNKCFLSIEDQVLLLEERGLIIHSKTEAEDFCDPIIIIVFLGMLENFKKTLDMARIISPMASVLTIFRLLWTSINVCGDYCLKH